MASARADRVDRDIRAIEAQIPRLFGHEATRARSALKTIRNMLAVGDDLGAEVLARTTLAWTSDAARFGRTKR